MPEGDVLVRLAQSPADYEGCVELQRRVWGLSDLEIASTLQLIASTLAGGTVHVAATREGRLVGFAYAFPALRGGRPHLHSDMLAVLPEFQKRGVGVRLKLAQREEAMARGLDLVTWTFDPLQARNAQLNLRRLGARATEFLENVYGVTSSTLHHGLPTDRLLVHWELRSPRVEQRLAGGEPPRSEPTPELPRINEVRWQAGWPVSSDPALDLAGTSLLLEIPPEFEVLAQAAPHVAADWHAKVRRALAAYFGRGYVASDLVPTEEAGRRRPFYLLTR